MKRRNLLVVTIFIALFMLAYGCGKSSGGEESNASNNPAPKNNKPVWQIAPSDIAIAVGTSINQINGQATDADASQTLACSLVSKTCSFPVVVSGSGSTEVVECAIAFSPVNSPEYCSVTVQVSDDAGGVITGSFNISIYPPVSVLAAGDTHSCAITTAGETYCWGYNGSGQLGDNSTAKRLTPVDIVGLSGEVAAISGGGNHTCALTTTGGAKCWGNNDYGQLGDNSTTDRLTPVDVCTDASCASPLSGVAAISAGGYHTCALTTAGGVKCWGYNFFGQLGDNTATDSSTPVDVVGLSSGVAAISSGGEHTCALTTGGGVICWGSNGNGQLGDNLTGDSRTPVNVVGLSSGVVAISTRFDHTCALTTTGGIKCWGFNYRGQLGDGTNTDQPAPVDVVGLSSGVMAVTTGYAHTCALTTAGGVKCWGYNLRGQLGDNSILDISTPTDVVGLSSGVAAISAGDLHTCALTSAAGVKCWGYNYYGELGDDTTTNRLTPANVAWL